MASFVLVKVRLGSSDVDGLLDASLSPTVIGVQDFELLFRKPVFRAFGVIKDRGRVLCFVFIGPRS